MTTRRIALTGMIAAIYALLVFALAPVSFSVLQFRVAGLLQGLALCNPMMALGLAVGNFLANLVSPFGVWDWGVMPFVTWAAAYTAWRLRGVPPLALVTQSVMIGAGVATFPLGLGVRLPWLPSFLAVTASMLIITSLGYICLAPAWRAIERELGL